MKAFRMGERGRKTRTQPGRGVQQESGSWRRRLGAAGRIGGKPGENHEEVTETGKTGLMVFRVVEGVRLDMDLSGHWASRRPLTSSVGAISWARKSNGLNGGPGRGHKAHSF